MKYLYNQEKILLGVLVGVCIVSVLLTIYLVKNGKNRNENSRGNIRILNTEKYATKGLLMLNQLAKNLADEYQYYTGFIVLSPEQELSSISSSLSYMLENLGKPVLVTNPDNAQKAIVAIDRTKIPEVMIFDSGHLVRAVNPNIILSGKNALASPEDPFQVKFIDPNIKIQIIKSEQVPDLRDKNIRGLVIATGPKINKKLLKIIPELTSKGVTVLVTGNNKKKLGKTGALDGKDITSESARAKMQYLCSHIKDPVLLSRLVTKNFRGEISE